MNKACADCGTSLHMSATRCRCGWQEKGKQADGRDSFACTAYGCPLIGSSTRGTSNDRYCTVHASHEEKDIQGITKGIRKRLEVFQLIARIAQLDQVTWWAQEPAVIRELKRLGELGYAGMVPTEYELTLPSFKWYSRVFADLETAILADMGIHRTPRKPAEPAAEVRRALDYAPDERAEIAAIETDLAARAAAREHAQKALEAMNSQIDF